MDFPILEKLTNTNWIQFELNDTLYFKSYFNSEIEAISIYNQISLNSPLTINNKFIIPISRGLSITKESKWTKEEIRIDIEGIQIVIES